jgi:hypothetical protein
LARAQALRPDTLMQTNTPSNFTLADGAGHTFFCILRIEVCIPFGWWQSIGSCCASTTLCHSFVSEMSMASEFLPKVERRSLPPSEPITAHTNHRCLAQRVGCSRPCSPAMIPASRASMRCWMPAALLAQPSSRSRDPDQQCLRVPRPAAATGRRPGCPFSSFAMTPAARSMRVPSPKIDWNTEPRT